MKCIDDNAPKEMRGHMKQGVKMMWPHVAGEDGLVSAGELEAAMRAGPPGLAQVEEEKKLDENSSAADIVEECDQNDDDNLS